MENIQKVVLEAYKEVLESMNLNIAPDLENEVGRRSGLDSLGIVDFVVTIEDKLDISLDSVLGDIRQCNKIRDVINIISKLTEK